MSDESWRDVCAREAWERELPEKLEENNETMDDLIAVTDKIPFNAWTTENVYYIQEGDYLNGWWVDSQPRYPFRAGARYTMHDKPMMPVDN